jgi:hypothetical protein
LPFYPKAPHREIEGRSDFGQSEIAKSLVREIVGNVSNLQAAMAILLGLNAGRSVINQSVGCRCQFAPGSLRVAQMRVAAAASGRAKASQLKAALVLAKPTTKPGSP